MGSPDSVHNSVSGNAEVVVQSGEIHGGVHIHSATTRDRESAQAALLDDLAAEVARQWRPEELVDQLPVRWTDAWPLDAAERTDEFEVALGQLTELVTPRLVVLGDPGIGKTTFAVHLLLGMLRQRARGGPVPVLLPVGRWDPARRSVSEWFASELAATYPGLGVRLADGATRAARLVADGLVIPILDGFDELPQQLRARALRRLNGGLRAGDRLVLTSRRAEFEEAVRAPGGQPVKAATVRVLRPTRIEAVRAYLRNSTAPHRHRLWDPVFDQLATENYGPLAGVLSVPAMAWLVKLTYAEGDADPALLLSFRHRQDIEDHLFGGLIATVYDPDRAADKGWDPARRRPSPPTVSNATRWMTFLAGELGRTGRSDVAWWRLEQSVPRTVMGAVVGVVLGLITGLMVAIPSGLTYGLATGLSWGVLGALVAGFGGGWMSYRVSAFASVPAAARPISWTTLRSPIAPTAVGKSLARHLLDGVSVGALGSVLTGVPVTIVVWADGRGAWAPVAGVTAATAVAMAIVVARTLDFWLSAPGDILTAVSPLSVLRGDRTTAVVQGIVGGLAFGLAFGLTRGVVAGLAAGVGACVTRFLAGGLDQGFSRIRLTAWSRFMIARLWLTATGKLPWRTMDFLRDARDRGVLRQVGSVYQFRGGEFLAYLQRQGS